MVRKIQHLLLSAVLVLQMLFGLGISYAEFGSDEQEAAVYTEVTANVPESYEATESMDAVQEVSDGEELTEAKDYTFVIIPDTQILTQNRADIFKKMVEWIVNNKEELNIQMVLHMGDVVNKGQFQKGQYQTAKDLLSLIDNAGIPMMIDIGNHDYDNLLNTDRNSTLFNQYFGLERYQDKPWFGGAYEEGKSENVYTKMEVEGIKYLFFALEFAPRDEVLQWVDQTLDENPDYKAVITTHAYVSNKGGRTGEAEGTGDPQEKYKGAVGANDGQDMWEKSFRKHENIEAVYSGHIFNPGIAYQTDLGDNGNVVFQSLQDFQGLTHGGQGRLRIVKYIPSEKKVVSWIFNTWTGKIENTVGNDLEYSTEKPADPSEWKQLKYFKAVTPAPANGQNTDDSTAPEDENAEDTASEQADENSADAVQHASDQSVVPVGVEIIDVNKITEVVKIKNNTNFDVDMTGWKLRSAYTEVGEQVYIFPDNYILKAGATVQVVSGGKASAGAGKLLWNKVNNWNGTKPDPAELYNDKGEKVSEFLK